MKLVFFKIIKHLIVKVKHTYIKKSSIHWALYLWVNGFCYEGIPLDVAVSHLTSSHRESMSVPDVLVLDQHLMTHGRPYWARTTSNNRVLTTFNKLFFRHLHKLLDKKINDTYFFKKIGSTSFIQETIQNF